jgi:hypothetical protein
MSVKRFIVLFVLFFGGIVFAGRLVPGPPGPHLLAMVPRESFCVLELHRPWHILSSLASTPLGKGLAGFDWVSLLDHQGIGKGAAAGMRRAARLYSLTATVMEAQRPFVRDTGVMALVPPEAGQIEPGPLSGSLLFLGRLQNKNSFSRLTSFLGRVAQLRLVQKDVIENSPVLRYQVPEYGFLYVARFRDVLLVSPVQAVIRQAISLARADQGPGNFSLFADRFFVRGRGKNTKKLQMVAYVNVRAIERLPGQSLQKPGLAAFLSGLAGKGLDKILLTWKKEGGQDHFTSLVRYRRHALPSLLRLCALRQPVENEELARVPAGITAYFWSNWFSPASWWQVYISHAGKNGLQYRDTADTVLKKYLSLSMPELTALFEYQWSVFVTGIKQSAFLPVPRLCLRLGMIDSRPLAALMEKSIAELPHRLDIVAATRVISLVMAGGLMEPSYTFINNDLWLFDGHDQVQEILQPGPARLRGEPAFQSVAKDSDKPSNLQLFVRMQPVVKGLLELYSWLGRVMAMPESPQGKGRRILLDRFVTPLAETLAGVESVFVTARIHSDEFEAQLRLQPGPGTKKGERGNE